jgi:hypothetical protein
VLVEKPATLNRKQYEVLCKHAKEPNVVLMEALWTRYLPATQYLKNELLPKIGQVKRVYAEYVSVAIPFPPIRPEELHMQRYGEEFLDAEGRERGKVIRKPVGREWGIWSQADVIAGMVREKRGGGGRGEVIGEEESLRVLGWMDEARKLGGILFGSKLEEV